MTDRIARFPFQYRNTPHSTTAMIPAELLMGRKLRSRLDLVKLNLHRYGKTNRDNRNVNTIFMPNCALLLMGRVYVKNHRCGDPWLHGEISMARGRVSYTVKLAGGSIVHSHQDHLQCRLAEEKPPHTQLSEDTNDLACQFSEDLSLLKQNVLSPDSE